MRIWRINNAFGALSCIPIGKMWMAWLILQASFCKLNLCDILPRLVCFLDELKILWIIFYFHLLIYYVIIYNLQVFYRLKVYFFKTIWYHPIFQTKFSLKSCFLFFVVSASSLFTLPMTIRVWLVLFLSGNKLGIFWRFASCYKMTVASKFLCISPERRNFSNSFSDDFCSFWIQTKNDVDLFQFRQFEFSSRVLSPKYVIY